MTLYEMVFFFPSFYLQLDAIKHGLDPTFAFYSVHLFFLFCSSRIANCYYRNSFPYSTGWPSSDDLLQDSSRNDLELRICLLYRAQYQLSLSSGCLPWSLLQASRRLRRCMGSSRELVSNHLSFFTILDLKCMHSHGALEPDACFAHRWSNWTGVNTWAQQWSWLTFASY